MKEYLSHWTATNHLSIPTLDIICDKESINKRITGEVIDTTVTSQSKQYQKKNHIIHVCERSLPRGAVIKHDDVFISSPELVFLELARELDISKLIFLGLQMCAHPPGDKSKAVTSKRKLKAFLEKTQGFHGHKKAECALRHIENGSASPMESIVFMILTLPHTFGGLGLSGATFNYEIPLDANAAKILKQKKCYADIFYNKAKLSVEYDSYTHHNSAKAQGKDHIRATALENQGIDVLRLTPIQLYDERKFKEFTQNLSSRLEKRIRTSRAKGFQEAHKNLRALLPKKSGDIN